MKASDFPLETIITELKNHGRSDIGPAEASSFLYPGSVVDFGSGRKIALFGDVSSRYLLSLPDDFLGFVGDRAGIGDETAFIAPLNHENAVVLRKAVPWTSPSPLDGHRVSFGLGDRLGLATPGHIDAVDRFDVQPVFAQQSVRELELMGRRYEDVVDDATWSVFAEGYRGTWVADGDHLKSVEWVHKACRAGCTMITADLSEHLDASVESAEVTEIDKRYRRLDPSRRERLETAYLDRTHMLKSGTELVFESDEMKRYALQYTGAVEFAVQLHAACREYPGAVAFEVSIDEVATPTSPAAHYFVASELRHRRVDFISLAPRFIGEFQKGIDYIGEIESFRRDFARHADVAATLGHKISVHSGSDKFSIFPVIGDIAEVYHIKTSGTNWLTALRSISISDPALFRDIHQEAIRAFPAARDYYHVTTDLEKMVDIEDIPDSGLSSVFDNDSNRQVLHITYGELLNNDSLRRRIFTGLITEAPAFRNELNIHISRHLNSLQVKESRL